MEVAFFSMETSKTGSLTKNYSFSDNDNIFAFISSGSFLGLAPNIYL